MKQTTVLRFMWLATGVLLLAAVPVVAQAQSRCQAPQVMVVVDKSSSMVNSGELPGGGTKWDAATMALSDLTSSFTDNIDFGLAVFPAVNGANSCDPGAITVPIGHHTSSEMVLGLGAPPPRLGNWTPTFQTLDVIGHYGPLVDGSRNNHVILITDGEQCCFNGGNDCDASQRYNPIASVMHLRAEHMTVHVIGFGAAVDPLVLNRAAVAGGTALPGCNADSEDPEDPNNCYLQADDLTGLRDALSSIARHITDEVCDGIDNDCDGKIDEGYDVDGDGYTTCGTGPSSPATVPSSDWADCDDTNASVNPGAMEVCNGIDDDCDGVIDPGCSCTDGQTRPCGTDIGACMPGEQTCVGGGWAMCKGDVTPVAETCDGIDQDCDGRVDEDATCADGQVCHEGACVDPMKPPPPPQNGGCACTAAGVASGGRSAPWALALALFGLALWVVRRRRGG